MPVRRLRVQVARNQTLRRPASQPASARRRTRTRPAAAARQTVAGPRAAARRRRTRWEPPPAAPWRPRARSASGCAARGPARCRGRRGRQAMSAQVWPARRMCAARQAAEQLSRRALGPRSPPLAAAPACVHTHLHSVEAAAAGRGAAQPAAARVVLRALVRLRVRGQAVRGPGGSSDDLAGSQAGEAVQAQSPPTPTRQAAHGCSRSGGSSPAHVQVRRQAAHAHEVAKATQALVGLGLRGRWAWVDGRGEHGR